MITRRNFLRTAAAASVPLILSPRALGREGPGPNDRVKVGVIGLGRRCWAVTGVAVDVPELEIVAISDCFKPRIDDFKSAFEEHSENWTGYVDFRRMIEKENLDAVLCVTTTHASSWVACHAMSAGLDAYIEKAMCLSVEEGRHMVNTARRHGVVTQIGTQQRSIPLNNWASDLVSEGAIGKIKKVEACNFVGPEDWTPKPPEPKPEGGTVGWWDVWTNQAPLRPYHTDIHRGWQRWRDYENGGLSFGVTGWGTHSYDQVQRGLGANMTTPVEVTLEEPYESRRLTRFEDGREPGPEETGQDYYWFSENDQGPRARVTMRYADGVELDLSLDADYGPGLGARFIGEDGYIEINRDYIWAEPYEIIERDDRPGKLEVNEIMPHLDNWIECIKSRKPCNADIEYAQRSHTVCFLVNAVRELGRVGETLHWDPVRERFTDSEEANALLKRERRAGYELPT